MLEKVKKTIKNNNLLEKGDKIVVALSGGCDSVCLALVLKELGYDVAVAHLNHGIRLEAKSDANFVKEFALRHNMELFVKEVNIPEIAQKEKISLETAGRNLRYEFFQEISRTKGYNKIAVAHNKNDNCETFLLNLIRGSGIKGLCSIPIKRDNIVRPLLEITRKEIEEYVSLKKETYVIDKSNFSNDYTRNKIRNIIVPQFLEISENFIDSVYKTSSLLKEDFNFIDEMAEKIIIYQDECAKISVKDIKEYPTSILARALSRAYEYVSGTGKDFEKKHIDYIINETQKIKHGNIIDLPFETKCSLRYGYLIFEKQIDISDYIYSLKENQEVYVKEADVTFTLRKIDKNEKIVFSDNCQYFSLPKGGVLIRNRKEGDLIKPFGSKSNKKLKKILIDKKTDRGIRSKLPLIEYDNEIIWAYGVVRSSLYKTEETEDIIYEIKGDKLL